MTERNSKDGKMAFEGGNVAFHHVEAGGLYGTHEGDKKEGSHAPDLTIRTLGSDALKPRNDDAERWLREHDPNYKQKGWNG